LRKIIDDFHEVQSSESLHRFWIEAESLSVAFDTARLEAEDVQTIHLYDVNMVVKKHKMIRNADEQLVDDQEKHEGWFFYLLNENQRKLFYLTKKVEHEPAIILSLKEGDNEVICSENGKQSAFTLLDCDEQLNDIRRYCKRDEDGKMIETRVASSLIYNITRQVSEQSRKPHLFSPEYIFAQEFTDHYEEFALYFQNLNDYKSSVES
jgi:hypothetical protein